MIGVHTVFQHQFLIVEVKELTIPKVQYVGWGIGNVIEGVIYLHKGLLKPHYKPLHDWILAHEIKHLTQNKYTREDFKHDIADSLSKPPDISKLYFKFYFQHSGAWLQSSPIFILNNKVYFDLPKIWTLCCFTTLALVVLWLIS